MPIGIVSNNAVPLQGSSWEDLFTIDVDALTHITRANFFVEVIGNDKHTWAECLYTGTDDLTTHLAELANFPKGSIIHAPVHDTSGRIIYKTAVAGTSGWKYDVVLT
jgi:hypothetical protein